MSPHFQMVHQMERGSPMAAARKHRRTCNKGKRWDMGEMGKLCNSGKLCVSGELEGGLTLRTQLRHGEQRASRCSLGVARSPVHIIFPPHHNVTHMEHRGQCAQGHTCDLATGGGYMY